MAASIILPSICSHQVAQPANNYTGMHLLKLMLGAPTGGDTRRIVSPFVCEGRPFHCSPWIPQQLDSTGRRHHGCDQLLSDASLRRKQMMTSPLYLIKPVLRLVESFSQMVRNRLGTCNFIVLRQAGNLVSLILTLTAFCSCSICMLLWNHMPLLMQLVRCCVSLMP